MSLVRLLTAGKSLVGARDEMSRYRVRKHVALPKFVSPKNPFAPQTNRGPVHAASAEAAPRAQLPAKLPAAAMPKRMPLATLPALKQPSPSVGGLMRFHPVRSLLQKLNPLPLLAGLKPAPKPVRAAFAQAAVQGELSLERVKVVRNDLSDADLEVVPMKSATTDVEAAPDMQAAMNRSTAAPSWEQWTARLFRVDQT